MRGGMALVLAAAVALGPPAAESAESVFETDFTSDSLEQWNPTDPKVWSIVEADGGRALALTGRSKYAPKVRSPESIIWLKDREFGDFVLDVNIKSTARDYGHRDLCFFLGRQSPSEFYYVHLGRDADAAAHSIFLVNNKPRVSIAAERTKGTPWTNGWHDVRIVRKLADGLIEVYFDDMNKPIMTAKDKTFGKGAIGLGSFDDTGMFRRLRARAP